MIEPNCDMPWEIYLDWLQDQGNEDLRGIDIGSVVQGISSSISYMIGEEGYGQGVYQSGEGYSSLIPNDDFYTGSGLSAPTRGSQTRPDGDMGYGCYGVIFHVYGNRNPTCSGCG